MAHPCRTGNPGTTLHACANAQSPKTLCGKDVHGATVGEVWGFKAVCSGCYPEQKNAEGPGDKVQIPGREHWKDKVL
jgi:hypothetical protein